MISCWPLYEGKSVGLQLSRFALLATFALMRTSHIAHAPDLSSFPSCGCLWLSQHVFLPRYQAGLFYARAHSLASTIAISAHLSMLLFTDIVRYLHSTSHVPLVKVMAILTRKPTHPHSKPSASTITLNTRLPWDHYSSCCCIIRLLDASSIAFWRR